MRSRIVLSCLLALCLFSCDRDPVADAPDATVSGGIGTSPSDPTFRVAAPDAGIDAGADNGIGTSPSDPTW